MNRDRLVLIGQPVAHSLSPVIQNAALRAAGIPVRYETLDVAPAGLAHTLQQLASGNSAGNITSPHKRTAMAHMGAVTAAAAAVGAVNTFWTDGDGHIAGDNTDVGGFAALAESTLGITPANSQLAVLGAGGAAAAVLAAVKQWHGCTVTVHARSQERAMKLCQRFSGFARAASMSDAALSVADIVVNATPIGLLDDDHPVDVSLLHPRAAVIDLVYRSAETAWVRAARQQGHRASDGLPMLIRQGALAFERWFRLPADEGVMWAAVTNATGRARPAEYRLQAS